MTNSQTISSRELMKIVIVGHVDHGKSTLVGRLFHDTDSLPEGKFEAIQAMCKKRGMPFEWAFLMDALQAERDQGITIDTSQIWFHTDARDYVIIDAPGHKEFLKNMVTGAAASDAALLIIDADEGLQEQSRRHGYLLSLLGVSQVAVVVNKMDLADYSEDRFREIERDYTAYLNSIGVTPTFVIPASAREGDCIVGPSENMPWYTGPAAVEALDRFTPKARAAEKSLRFPIQDVYKFDNRRILAGRIESGTISVGDRLLFSPTNKTATVKSIETWNAPEKTRAEAGESVGITLDEQLFIERGHIASHEDAAPVETDVFKARIFWLGHEPLVEGRRYKIKLNTAEHVATVQKVEHVIDTSDLSAKAAREVARNEVGEVVLRTQKLIAVDPFEDNDITGRFVMIDGYDIAGGGNISMEGYADQRAMETKAATNIYKVAHAVTEDARTQRNGHKGGVLWFTGLSGAGKSTIALEVEKQLFARGYQSYVLDGDNVRDGLNANLGFSPEDRSENIRRVGEVAALFSRAGMIAVTAFISPYLSDRARARRAAGEDFHEIHIKADVATCEKRDPKGLYKRARAGEIPEFTGISAPYEAPEAPELVIDTAALSVEESVAQVLTYVEEHFTLGVAKDIRAEKATG